MQREERYEADGDTVQLPAVALLKGGVEQVPDDLWEREPDRRRGEETSRRNDQPAAVRAKPGQQPA